MKSYFITQVFGFFCLTGLSYNHPINDQSEAALYLQKFGYFEDIPGYGTAAMLGPDAIANALKDFQRFAGLNQTGELDNNTIHMMNTPRCGVKDKIGHSESARYVLRGTKWPVTQLTYRISKYPTTRIFDNWRVDREIARAFKVWSDVTPLTFEERKRGRVDIDIRFQRRDHGDGVPFDGLGRTLAHAFFPHVPELGGDAHFDDDEQWTLYNPSGTNIFQVAAHEFGHSLGLDHSDEKQAVMFPYYRGYELSFKLHSDDIEGIQLLYGTRDQPSVPEEPLGPPPDLCQDGSIDAITRTQNGRTYVFKGDFYWEVLSDAIADGYPRIISDDWDRLEGNLDASLTWPDGKTFFFKGGRYWRFTNRDMDSGYPKLIHQGFPGVPDTLDAAVVWSGNSLSYFFKGNQYWRYDSSEDPPVADIYPIPITEWTGLPAHGIDAAVQWENNRTYFFKGDKYYKFDDNTSEVESADPPYPRSTSVWWFHCN